jgi:urease accessory protein
MKRFLTPVVALSAGATLVLGTHPAMAHGIAAGGALGGLTHPLLGLDHLFMLLAVGIAASVISSQLLVWAVGAAVVGAAIGFAGFSVTAAELLAAVAIAAVAGLTVLTLQKTTTDRGTLLTQISGVVVAGGVTVHAMLHGLEAPEDASTLLWWVGALVSSALVVGGTYLAANKLPAAAVKTLAVAVLAAGGLLTLGSLGLLGTAGA